MLIGYARVSTDDQTLDLQRDALTHFQRRLVSERTREGIDAARKRGRKPGRPALDPETVSAAGKLIEAGMSPARAAKQLAIGRATAYRIAADQDAIDRLLVDLFLEAHAAPPQADPARSSPSPSGRWRRGDRLPGIRSSGRRRARFRRTRTAGSAARGLETAFTTAKHLQRAASGPLVSEAG